MNRSILMLALVAALGLSACERQPTVVTVPAPVAEPGPAGPQEDEDGQGPGQPDGAKPPTQDATVHQRTPGTSRHQRRGRGM